MVKSYRYQEIQPSLWCPEIRGSAAHTRALVGTIQASTWSRMINLRPLLACNSEQCFTFPASDVWSETIQTLARKATLTRMPRKIRLSQRIASYLWERLNHLPEVEWEVWDHFWHATRSNRFHFRPQIGDTKNIDLLIHGWTVDYKTRQSNWKATFDLRKNFIKAAWMVMGSARSTEPLVPILLYKKKMITWGTFDYSMLS